MIKNKSKQPTTPDKEIEALQQGEIKTMTLDEISKEDLIDVIGELQSQLEEKEQSNTYIVEPLSMTDEEIEEVVKSEEYQRGVKLGAEILGFYTTLVNGGMSLESATDMVTNYQTLTFNVESVKTQAKTLKRSSGA
jgi:hypothetical protein